MSAQGALGSLCESVINLPALSGLPQRKALSALSRPDLHVGTQTTLRFTHRERQKVEVGHKTLATPSSWPAVRRWPASKIWKQRRI